jgi:hypothetical protein
MIYILKAVVHNNLHSRGSRTERYAFSRQPHRTFQILKTGVQNVRYIFSRQSHKAFYFPNTVPLNPLYSQGSRTGRSTFSMLSHWTFHSTLSMQPYRTFNVLMAVSQSSTFSKQSCRTFYIHSESFRFSRQSHRMF